MWSISNFSSIKQADSGKFKMHDSNGGENLAFFEPRCDYTNTLSVHQTLSDNRASAMFDVCERLVPPRANTVHTIM